MSEAPILCTWQGDGFTPAGPRWQKEADKLFTIGEQYLIAEVHERSRNSHSHFFASLTEAWRNLPEDISERFPTVEHLRKYALIKAGFCDSQTLVCSSKAEAVRVASFVRPCDEFGVVTVKDQIVTRYTAKSQSYRAMGKDDFQRSKETTLEIVAEMIGTTAKTLSDQSPQGAHVR